MPEYGLNEASDDYDGKTPGEFWRLQLDHAENVFKTWSKRGDEVVERYRDDRGISDDRQIRSKFNILWANTQVLKPALYGRKAKIEVSRRYLDANPAARLASEILERVIQYEIEQFPDFQSAMEQCVEDRLLPGRGTAWVRWDPVIQQEQLQPPETQIENVEEPITTETIVEAHSPVDYVYWKDFLHSPARTWNEVWWVSRWVYLTKEEGMKRFGDVFENVPLTEYKEDNRTKGKDETGNEFAQKAKVAEIWNIRTKRVCWLAKGYPEALDEKDDPLNLEGFFPCPKPLFGTMTNGSLIPVPDFAEYQDQARELDRLTQRIDRLTRAIKAVGVFNAEFKEVARLLQEGTDNELIPVSNWAALVEKGGLKAAIELMDIGILQSALATLMNAREMSKQIIYEISGISDIIRGATKAEETLGAQQLKAQFGSMRLKTAQADVARFASDLFRLKAQIICSFYPPQYMVAISGIQGTPEGQNQQLLFQALGLLKNSTVRDFQINVSSDTLAQIDEQQEKENAGEMVTAIGTFMKSALETLQIAPEFLPMASEMLKFILRRYHVGRMLESSVDQSVGLLQQRVVRQQQNPQPSKEQIEAEQRAQADQFRAQLDTQAAQMKAQYDAQVQQGKLQQEAQLETLKSAQEERMAKLEGQIKLFQIDKENQMEQYKADLASKTAIEVALIGHNSKINVEKQKTDASVNTELLKQLADRVMNAPPPKPKLRRILRDKTGRAVGISTEVQGEPAQQQQILHDENGQMMGIADMPMGNA